MKTMEELRSDYVELVVNNEKLKGLDEELTESACRFLPAARPFQA